MLAGLHVLFFFSSNERFTKNDHKLHCKGNWNQLIAQVSQAQQGFPIHIPKIAADTAALCYSTPWLCLPSGHLSLMLQVLGAC